MIPLSKILFFVLLIILLVLVALLITSLAGGFSRDECNMRKKQFYNYPVENYNYSGGRRQKSLKYGGAPLNLLTVFQYNNALGHTNTYKTDNERIIYFIFTPKPTFIYGGYCNTNKVAAPIAAAIAGAAAAPPKNFDISFQDSTLLYDNINAYNRAMEAAFVALFGIIADAVPGSGSLNEIKLVADSISDLDVAAVTNLHDKMNLVFNNAGGGSFELLVDAKTRYNDAITDLAPQITACYNKCADVTAAIGAAVVPIATIVCNAIEAYDIDLSAKDASDNTILPILAEHHGNLAAIELAHINADNLKTGVIRNVLAAPAIGINAAGTSAFDQTDLQVRTAAVAGANTYITAVSNKHGYINIANLAAYEAVPAALDAEVVRSYNGIHTFLNTSPKPIAAIQALITEFEVPIGGGGAGAPGTPATATAADAIIGGGATPMQGIYAALAALNTSYTAGGAYHTAFTIVEEINTDNAGNAEITEIHRLLSEYNLDFNINKLTYLDAYINAGTHQQDAEAALAILIATDVAAATAAAASAGAGAAFVPKLYTVNADISTNLIAAVNAFHILYTNVINAIQNAKTAYAMFDNSIPIVNEAIAVFNGSVKDLAAANALKYALNDNYNGLLLNTLYERAVLALGFGGRHIIDIYTVTDNQVATAIGGVIVAQPINDAIKIYTDIRDALNPVTALNASLNTFTDINHNITELTAITTAITTFNLLPIPNGMHAIAAIAADAALLTTLGTDITAYIAAAKTEITRIVTTYKGQLGIYNATAGSADITTAINTYIDEVIVGDATNVGLSLTNTAFLAKLDALDAAIKKDEQNAMFYGEIAGVANPEHIHQLVTDIAAAKAAMDAYDFATLIPAYEVTLNELNDAIYECYNIFEVVATAAAASPGKVLHQAIYNAAGGGGAGYYHAITETNRILNGIGATGGANPYTATFTEKYTITTAANLALTAVHNGTHPRTIQEIAVAGSNDNITLIKVEDVHYFGYETALNTYIISYKIRELINGQLTPIIHQPLGTIGALSNTFTIYDVGDNNAFTIGANLQDIKNILESHEITIFGIPNNILYVGNTVINEYIFWDNTAPGGYREYAINSIQMFNLEVTDIVADKTKKIRFVDTAAKIHAVGNLEHYAPTAIISMAHSAVGAQELTPYKVFTHKGADDVYEIDNVLYASFNLATTIRIPPIITDTGAGIIDTNNRIKDITYGPDFLNNLKRGANHNYYHSVNDLTVDQFAHNFEIHNITEATGVLQNAGGDITIVTPRNIYQILFYQPLLDFSSNAATINGFSNAELARVANLNHNYRIHIDNIAKTRQESYFGLYDVLNDGARPQLYHHKMYISDTLPTKQIGVDPADQFLAYQHNLIYTFEKFKENAAAADTEAVFIEQMNILTGHILYNTAANDEKVAILYYDNGTREFNRNASDMANLTTLILLYDLYCINNDYNNMTTNRGFDHQEIFILDNMAAVLNRVTAPSAGADPTHVKKYTTFGSRSYYLYSSNAAVAAPHSAHRHRMTTNTLDKLRLYSIGQATDINAGATNTDKLDKFLENITCTPASIIDIATAPFLNTIRFRYNISAASDIKTNVDAPDKTVAKSVDITAGSNHYDTMIDNCYHVMDLANVADINSIITSDNKKAFCQLAHLTGIIYRSDNLNTYSNFSNNNLSSIPFIHEDNTNPPTLNREKTSIVGAIILKYKDNIAGVYAEIILNNYLGCGCIGHYDKGGANWHTTGGIVHYDAAAHNIKIFDDNANTRNFIDGANAAAAANFAIYDVSLMNTILDNNRPEQKVIFYTSATVNADYPAIDAGNCNAIIPLQSDKDNTPFEDTEFHYYFGGYHNNKYYLSENIGTYMIADRNALAVDAGPFANLKNLRIDHLIKKYKTPNSPLLFKEYGAVIDIADVKKIIKQYMVCEYLPAANQLFEHDTVGDIDAAADIDAIPTTGGNKLLSDMRIPVPRIEPYHKIGKYEHVPYNATIDPKPRAITHELRINNYMGGNLSFFGIYETALANMTVDANDINSRIFRYSDNIEYNRIIKAAFMMHRPYQIYVPPAVAVHLGSPILLNALHPDPLKYVWISGELSINLDGLSPFSAFNDDLNTLSTVSSPALLLTDVILYTTATEVLESDEARLRVAPSVKEPEPVKETEPELVQYAADIHVQKQKALKEWISQLNMDSGKSHLVDTDGKTIPNDSNSRHNHPGATEVATIQIKEVEIVKSERDYKKMRDNYIKEVNIAKKHGKPIPKAKIYIIPSSKDWLRHQKNKKTFSLVDKNGNLDLSNIPNGKYIYNSAVIEF